MPRLWNLLGLVALCGLLGACSSPSANGGDGAVRDSGKIEGVNQRGNSIDRPPLDVGDGGDAALDLADVGDAPAADGPVDAVIDAPLDVPSEPDVPRDVAPEVPLTNQPNGAPCATNSTCRTNFCVDGVCCENACNNGCSACSQAKTGQRDGACAGDRARDREECGTYCAQIAPAVLGVREKVCLLGQCVPSPTLGVKEICQSEDRCTISFCDESSASMARCVHTVCPQPGTCCCGGGTSLPMCVQRTSCTGDRSCS